MGRYAQLKASLTAELLRGGVGCWAWTDRPPGRYHLELLAVQAGMSPEELGERLRREIEQLRNEPVEGSGRKPGPSLCLSRSHEKRYISCA